MSTEPLRKGTLIDGRYAIGERLGQGGMATVYRAVDMKIGHVVALKMIKLGATDKTREDRRARFAREILAINEIRHPNVLHVQEYGFHRDTPYMVMEFLDGKDLATVLRENDGPLAVEYAVDIMLAVCAAMRACHASQVIHRDLKPSNIMLVKTEVGAGWDVRVVDFGVSKIADASSLTQEGKIVGTPQFLSPEQIAGKAGPESDQYAIGVVLYECLTRRRPYDGLDGPSLARAIEAGLFKAPREHVPAIPEELERIVLKAMQVRPAERYPSVFELGKQLWHFASPMGRQVWQRYYETPPVTRTRDDEDPSSPGVPLVRRIAEGRLRATTATVVAHYQSTTAVPVAQTVTLDEPSTITTISKQRRESAAGATDDELVDPAGSRFGSRALALLAAVAAALAIVGLAALWSAGSSAAVGTTARAGAASVGLPTASVPLPPPALPAPPIAKPPAPAAKPPAPAAIAPVAATTAVAPSEREPEARKPARRLHRHSSHRQPAAPAEWTVDPAGNLIAPP
jgi:serine/threonine protein kinase